MTFLPQDLNGWLSLVVQFTVAVAAALAFVVKFVRKPLAEELAREHAETEKGFKEQGERIGKVEGAASAGIARIEATDRVVERLHLTMTALSESHGRQDARLDRYLEVQERHERERLTEDRNIGERLARIETRLDVSEDLRKIFTQALGKGGGDK